jgi:hypothetical protein
MNTDRLNELLDVWTMNLPLVQPFYSANCNIDPVLLRILAVHPSMGFNCTNQKVNEFKIEIQNHSFVNLARNWKPCLISLPLNVCFALIRAGREMDYDKQRNKTFSYFLLKVIVILTAFSAITQMRSKLCTN